MTTESNIGKMVKLGNRVYAIGNESTPEKHPALWREGKMKYELGVKGARGAYGALTIWPSTEHGQRAAVVWLAASGRMNSRTERFVGAAGAFEPYEPTTPVEKALAAEVVAEVSQA